MTTEENVIKNLTYLAPIGNSDHCILTFEYICQPETVTSKTRKYKYDKGDYSGMKDALSSIDWNSELNNLSVQDAWNNFSGVLEKAMEDHIPTHTIGSRPNKKRQAYMDRQGMKLTKPNSERGKHTQFLVTHMITRYTVKRETSYALIHGR